MSDNPTEEVSRGDVTTSGETDVRDDVPTGGVVCECVDRQREEAVARKVRTSGVPR